MKKRNIRKKRTEEDGEDDTNESTGADPAAIKAAQKQREKDRRKASTIADVRKQSLLSFDETLTEAPDKDTFPVKPKKSSSFNRAPEAHPFPPTTTTINNNATTTPRGGEYSKEHLEELRNSTFKLHGTFKQGQPTRQQEDHIRIHHNQGKFSTQATEDKEEAKTNHDNGGIPDAEAIKRAKAKREQLRAGGARGGGHGDGDYIPLVPSEYNNNNNKEVVDNDEDMEDAVQELEMEDDEGQQEWMDEQYKKAVGGGRGGKMHGASTTVIQGKSTTQGNIINTDFVPSQTAAINGAAEQAISGLRSALERLNASEKQATHNLTRTEQNLQECQSNMVRLERDSKVAGEKYTFMQSMRAYIADLCNMLHEKAPLIEELEEASLELRKSRARAFFERRQAEDTALYAPAEAAVAAALGVLAQGAGGGGAGGGRDLVATQAAAAAAAAAAEAAEDERLAAGLVEDMPIELDEFGRDSNAGRKRALVKQAQSQKQRIKSTYDKMMITGTRTDEGSDIAWTTTEEEKEEDNNDNTVAGIRMNSELSSYYSRMEEINDAMLSVFKDADEDFASITAVKSRLEEWKARFPATYHDAYVSLSAPALFAPFVRLELLDWLPFSSPLHTDTNKNGEEVYRLDRQQWYTELFSYGLMGSRNQLQDGGGGEVEEPMVVVDASDPDHEVIPRLLSKIILPIVKRLFISVWDPLSYKQGKVAALILGELLVHLPSSAGNDGDTREAATGVLDIIKIVEDRIKEAMREATVPPWPPVAVAASQRAKVCMERRFSRAVRLLGVIGELEAVLQGSGGCGGGDKEIGRWGEDVLTRQLIPHLRSVLMMERGAEKVGRVVAVMSERQKKSNGGRALKEMVSSMVMQQQQGNQSSMSEAAFLKMLATL